jgi:hypothetical protein
MIIDHVQVAVHGNFFAVAQAHGRKQFPRDNSLTGACFCSGGNSYTRTFVQHSDISDDEIVSN